MKRIKFFITILTAAALFATGCAPGVSQPEADENPNLQIMLSIGDTAPKPLSNSQNIQLSFNLKLLKELSRSEENIFYSAFSINQALTMAYFGSGGQTQQEMQDALGYMGLTIEDIAAYQKYLLETYENTGDTTFYSANSLWIDDQFPIYQSYIDTMENNFSAEAENLDLQSANAPKTLNKWIDKKTKGMITKLFDEPFDPMVSLVLMNAIYFKGEWTTPFDPDMTRDWEFNGANGTVTANMMYSDSSVSGYEGDNYKAISLPYGEDERFRMVAVLPENDINEFIQGLSEQSLNDMLTTFETIDEAKVLLPKFEMEEFIVLNDTLKTLGIKSAFAESADFSGISQINLYISDVLHKARIIVDEEGTEAAAVTAIVMKATSMPMNVFEFFVDKPFVFFITDTQDDTVLFTGVMYDLD